MAVRFATPNDVPGMVDLGQRMHALTRFRTFDYNRQRVDAALRAAVGNANGRYVCLVAENSQQQIVGLLLAVLEQHIFSDQLVASIMHYDVLPEARMGGWGVRLLRAFEQWATNRQVLEISFGINSGDGHEAVGRFATRMGFVKVGELFVKTRTP